VAVRQALRKALREIHKGRADCGRPAHDPTQPLCSNRRERRADLREQLNECPHARPVVRAFVAADTVTGDRAPLASTGGREPVRATPMDSTRGSRAVKWCFPTGTRSEGVWRVRRAICGHVGGRLRAGHVESYAAALVETGGRCGEPAATTSGNFTASTTSRSFSSSAPAQ
jgi:hypothetical protein